MFFWRIWCIFGVFGVLLCVNAFWLLVGVWFGVFGMLSSLKMCRFLIINFAESSLYCVFLWKKVTLAGKKYTTACGAVGTNMRYG